MSDAELVLEQVLKLEGIRYQWFPPILGSPSFTLPDYRIAVFIYTSKAPGAEMISKLKAMGWVPVCVRARDLYNSKSPKWRAEFVKKLEDTSTCAEEA